MTMFDLSKRRTTAPETPAWNFHDVTPVGDYVFLFTSCFFLSSQLPGDVKALK